MITSNWKESIVLFFGDSVVLYMALFLTLGLRALLGGTEAQLSIHVLPFTILILVWLFLFFVAGLYEKHTLLFKSKLPVVILNTQIVNSIVAVLFFYFIPYFEIAPKTNLFLYLLISFVLLVWWRLYEIRFVGLRNVEKALLIGSGKEVVELESEVNHNRRYSMTFAITAKLTDLENATYTQTLISKLRTEQITVCVIDLKNEKIEPLLPHLYSLIFANIKIIDIYRAYEDIFDRIPLPVINYSWFLEHLSRSSHVAYDVFKRTTDLLIATLLGVISLVVYPFVALGIKLDDGGPVFITQRRLGHLKKEILIYKFRSMQTNEDGVWLGETQNKITRVGKFLRKSRIDELPQLWNVIKGDISLIGPRPDTVALETRLASEIPYYAIRYLIKPGLSGWAQIKHDVVPQSIEENKERLTYDLYYIKNRSIILDVKILFQTIKTLLSRTGV